MFKEAKDGAGMTDDAQGSSSSTSRTRCRRCPGSPSSANQNLPPEVENNLRPLRSALLFGSRDGDIQSFVAYVKTS